MFCDRYLVTVQKSLCWRNSKTQTFVLVLWSWKYILLKRRIRVSRMFRGEEKLLGNHLCCFCVKLLVSEVYFLSREITERGYKVCRNVEIVQKSWKKPQNCRYQKGNLNPLSLCAPTNMTRNGAELFVALATCLSGFVHPCSCVYNSTIDVNMLMTTG